MQLADLISAIRPLRVDGDASRPVAGVTNDSRRAGQGCLFVAIKGFRHDGHDFVADAIASGATAVVLERYVPVPPGVTAITVADTRLALALLASQFYGHPSRALRMIGVTGTNGKTTTTHLIRSILRANGAGVGLIGTIHNLVGDEELPVERTTPEATDLQALLSRMLAAGAGYAVMEVSSHALSLKRVEATEFDVAVLTNITQDHLDFHESFQAYVEAKARLFWGLGTTYIGRPKGGPKHAVINLDDPSASLIMSRLRVPAITYSTSRAADVRPENVSITTNGISYRARTPAGPIDLDLKLAGDFNVANSLAAVAAALAEGVPPAAIAAGLAQVPGVPGRFENVDCGQDFGVIVDYAHTPDGLENVLASARRISRGRVIAVFGCGGDRDRTKRPIMGEIAARHADISILTSDNPRSEDPDAIIAEIEVGTRRAARPGSYELIADRARAIERALELARPGDVVVIAGKGHETYQIFRDRTIHFDDREVAAGVLRRMAR